MEKSTLSDTIIGTKAKILGCELKNSMVGDEVVLSGGNNDAHVIVIPFRLSAVLAGLRAIV